MKTPICDFVQSYAQRHALRLHMPGHKGHGPLGVEQLDITEIEGADSLYEANGIIQQSEENAGALFGCRTFYSTEGSSLCIRAMLYLALQYAKHKNKAPLIAAARNVHKSFLSAVAMLDLDVLWLYPNHADSYLSCQIRPDELDGILEATPEKPAAIYLTSPDYLGYLADVSGIARVCRKHDVLLLVDNAHGAYLRFIEPSLHPMDLGADMCCDSAHKTLPVLTGGAYLHISPSAPELLAKQAKSALSLFGSTSPSYLILQSLDAANPYLQDHPRRLAAFLPLIHKLKRQLCAHGYTLCGDEPLKLTIATKSYGYRGNELAQMLQQEGIVCEFSDPDYLVLMFTPENSPQDLLRLEQALLNVPPKVPLLERPPEVQRRKPCMSVREALLSASETAPLSELCARILATPSVSCPPAVPILVCGEQIDENAVACFRYYGINACSVVTEQS